MSDVEFAEQAPPKSAEDPAPPADDEAPRRRLGARSLTARLVVGVVGLVVLLVAAVSGGTYYLLRKSLSDRLDAQLVSTAQRGQLDQLLSYQGTYPVQPPQDVWVVGLRNGSGQLIGYPPSTRFPDSAVKALQLSDRQRRRIAGMGNDQPFTIRTNDGVELRAVTRSVEVKNSQEEFVYATVVIGLSTDEEHKTLEKLLSLELIIGGLAIVVALIATLLGVRFSLRHLRRVTATAQDVAAEVSPTGAGLDRRVEFNETERDTEVGQLAESMNTLLSAVETQFAARLKSEARLRQFLADASHELRTPLTSIRGYAELARMQKAAGASADDNLSRIESEGTRMSRLVEDLLLLARGERPAGAEPVRELVDVAELVEDAATDTRAAYPDREIRVESVPDLHVVGDRDQLLRAVRNLVTNAATHTAPDRPITVRGTASGHDVVIEVADGGPGLTPEDAAHVFERFWRADKARSRARGGTGLGMSIVATIITAHGGSVRFDSTVEGGSTVTIWLPGT